jgi:N-acetylneuraminic acid mutarotase
MNKSLRFRSQPIRLFIAGVFAVSFSFSHAMRWSFPEVTNSPSHVVAASEIAPSQVLAAGTAGETRLLDTATSQWTARASMNVARNHFSLTVLGAGQVLATGGYVGFPTNSVSGASERYDRATDSWTSVSPLLNARDSHLSVRLSDGKVLVVGGYDQNRSALLSTELFDQAVGTWTLRANSLWAVSKFDARMFADQVGNAYVVHPNGVGIYRSSTNAWTDAPPPPTVSTLPARSLAAAQLGDGRLVVDKMGIYDPATNSWTAIPAAPASFSNAAAVSGNRVVFAGGGLIPCTASVFCQLNVAYEYSTVTNEWLSLGSSVGTSGPDISLESGSGYFAGVNQQPANGYAMSGAIYRKSAFYVMYITNELDLPLSPLAGQSYSVQVAYSTEGDLLSRAPTGTVNVSDGNTSCQFQLPALSCTLTTTVSGPKTIEVSYSGDLNFTGKTITYTPQPHVFISRTPNARVQSVPGGISDIGFLYSLAFPFAAGTSVTLNALTTTAFTFTGWQGECASTFPCTFTMPADRHVYVKAFAAPNANAPFNLDIDRDGRVTIGADGLVALRYLLSFPDSTVATNALPANSTPVGGSAVSYLDGIRPRLDIDANGRADALTDGLLILRFLAGFRGDALIVGGIGSNARRITADEIETYLTSLLP